MLNADSPLPLYHQLAGVLSEQIRAGAFPEGGRLPSEHALSAQYGLSRPTVRQATDVLLRRGLIERRRGSGTFVKPRPPQVDLFSLAGTLKSFRDSGLAIEVSVLEAPKRVRVADDEDHPFAGQEALRMQRLSRMSGRPVLLEKLWLDPTLFAALEGRALGDASLSQLVEEELFLRPLRAEQRFRVCEIGGRDGRLLGLRSPGPVLLVERSIDFRPRPGAIYGELYCRTDRLSFAQVIEASQQPPDGPSHGQGPAHA